MKVQPLHGIKQDYGTQPISYMTKSRGRVSIPTSLTSFSLVHVLLSQQPQYAILATRENSKTSTRPTSYYPHTKVKEEERNFDK